MIINQAINHLPEKHLSEAKQNNSAVCTEQYKQAKRMHPDTRDKNIPNHSKKVLLCKYPECFVYCISTSAETCTMTQTARESILSVGLEKNTKDQPDRQCKE